MVVLVSGPATSSALPPAHPRGSAATARGIGDARQAITVVAAYGATRGRLSVLRRRSGGWERVMGPWPVWIGRAGLAPPGDKREGDGRTPSGTFRLPFAFGRYADPGLALRYRRARATSYWDDDSASPRYNQWTDSRRHDPGRDPEPMLIWPYRYGLVIGYNTARQPHRGSAIFLHVTHGNPTAGCVALAEGRLLRVLRWLRPDRHPRIVLGTASTVSRALAG